GHTRSCSFFFSSRRRHTRSTRDWSSDVCSSDLHVDERQRRHSLDDVLHQQRQPLGVVDHANAFITTRSSRTETRRCPITRTESRSEERRVGKECSSRWWPSHEEKKEVVHGGRL